jgi:DNA-binding helix-hairpin-helix protein with protein kinase domain
LPPELLGAALGATRRTANHDAFGLAVLIFHLLFMGRHPFAGRYLGKGDMPIERAIAESRFAYSRDTGRTRTAPPPYTPSTDAVGPAVTELLERAFHADARKSGRPASEAWIDALDALNERGITNCLQTRGARGRGLSTRAGKPPPARPH